MNRQKFIRALGLLPLLNTIFAKKSALASNVIPVLCKTQKDQEGPFYKEGSPERLVIETEGTPLQISGLVLRANDCSTPVANAILDIWHCDNHGEYDMQGFKCRGQIKSDNKGRYSFTSIFPPAYGGRPRHIHIKVRAEGYNELTTQIYFKGDPEIKKDFARNAEASRVISLTSENNIKMGSFNIYL